jgi:iron complex transport system substrate-binding protein
MAEEVRRLEPDLVIAQEYSTTATVSLLQRLGFRVVLVPLATDFESIAVPSGVIAGAVGEKARGGPLIAAFDARMAARRSCRGQSARARSPIRSTA